MLLLAVLGHTTVVKHLLAAGADPAVTVGGQTARDIARAFEQTDILHLLSDGCGDWSST